MKDRLFVISQYLLPHHLISRLAGCLAECRIPWLKNAFIKCFARHFQVDMSQAQIEDLSAYEHFNAFFTRALRDGARPLDPTPGAILNPCDGAISQLGKIEQGRIFQAKGHSYSVTELLGGDHQRAAPFMGGDFATVYLSPKDYHRVHMPITGTLREMVYVPGRIFSVNTVTAQGVPELFARNERVVCVFDSAQGPFVLVLVGATIVGSMATVWHGVVNPPRTGALRSWDYADQSIVLEQGDEMGRFLLGSTVVLLFPQGPLRFNEAWAPAHAVRLGQSMAMRAAPMLQA